MTIVSYKLNMQLEINMPPILLAGMSQQCTFHSFNDDLIL